MRIKKVVLAYSGGLDTSVAMQWLKERFGCEVIAYCADLGQEEDMKALKTKALRTGASKVYITDACDEFVREYVFPMLRANAVYEGSYLMGTSIARPLIAKKQMEIAKKERADAVAHGATGKGNDQVRFELTYYALNPHIKVIAPWREWQFDSRAALLKYAKQHNIPVPVTKKKPYSIDRNIFHISYEGGVLEDPWAEPPKNMYTMTVPQEKAPDRAVQITVGFRDGNPVSLNGKVLSPVAILKRLNTIGGKNGIGRVDIVENRFVGMKSRGVYETPGGTILHVAHRAIESLTLDREVMHLRDSLIPKYSELIYNGYWFTPEREALQAFIDSSQKGVTGTVKLKLYKGNCVVLGRKAPQSLYRPELATFEAEEVYDQKDAEGFIKLNALRLKLSSKIKQQKNR
jgi:argininosuccinate synthase